MTPEQHKQFTADFTGDVAEHRISVLLDDGLYRRIRFARPDTGVRSFELVTWPGRLAYTGDMGDFVFARLPDMFDFFRLDGYPERLPDFGYWAEKCVAVDRAGGTRAYAPELFIAEVRRQFDAHVDQNRPVDAAELWEEIEVRVLSAAYDGEYEARRAMLDFAYRGTRPLDAHECGRLTEYSHHFLWACHAIAWGIQRYDEVVTGRVPA